MFPRDDVVLIRPLHSQANSVPLITPWAAKAIINVNADENIIF